MKWNQCIGGWKETKVPWLHMHLYASVLSWYNVWWLNYMFICNHFGWNETSILGIERKSRYHGYICLYMLQYWIGMMCDDWIICSYVTILVEMKPVYLGLKGNQGTIVTYVSISFSIKLKWCVMTELYVYM